jgi:hypothetical protein
MSLLAYALTTRARVKTFLGITATDDDALIDSLINAVTNFIENYCDRRFKKTTYTAEVYDGGGGQLLLLKQYPVITFTSLEERDSSDNQDSWTAIDSEDYFVKLAAGIIEYINGRFKKLPQHYRATYQAGYDFDPAGSTTLESVGAGDLEWAAWKLIQKIYHQRQGDPDISNESLGDYSVGYRAELMEDPVLKGILDNYKRPCLFAL